MVNGSVNKRHHSEAVKQDALARLALGDSAYAVGKALGIPQTTVQMWRRHNAIATDVLATVSKEEVVTAGQRWAAVQELATGVLAGNLQRYYDDGTKLEPHELKDVAIVAGISADKHQDYTLGRKGMQVNVDARQQSVNVFEAMPREKLLELLSGDD